MTCLNCGAAAQPGQRFCAQCGTHLEGQLGRAYFLAQRATDAEVALRRTIEAAEETGPEEALIQAIVSLGSMRLQEGASPSWPCSSAAGSWRAALASSAQSCAHSTTWP